jgi:glycosyltransferase involved in cell wall biosynthesis
VRVLIDTTFTRRGRTGAGVYVERLLPALRAEGVEVVEAANERRRPPAGGGLGSVRNLVGDIAWTQVRLRRREGDVVHHPMPAHIRGERRPQVVTVHDVAYEVEPGWFDARYRAFASRALWSAAQRAEVVICGTHATARDLRDRWGIERDRIVVAPYGPGQELDVAERGEPRHFLYVGDAEPRKDLPTLLAAHARYAASAPDPLPLVLAGSATAHQTGVHVAGPVSREELARLHTDAAALVHTAHHEGFGLTVVEALHAGTPVIAVRNQAVAEVAGEHALLVEPGDVDALAAALANPPQPRRDRRFSWAACARAHIEAYRLALET